MKRILDSRKLPREVPLLDRIDERGRVTYSKVDAFFLEIPGHSRQELLQLRQSRRIRRGDTELAMLAVGITAAFFAPVAEDVTACAV